MKVIGVDAGGTKTSFALYDEQGRLIDRKIDKSCHYMRCSDQEMRDILRGGVIYFEKKYEIRSDELVLCFGMAGYGVDRIGKERIENTITTCFDHYAAVYIRNDAQMALEAALGGEDGIVIISGTGSIGYAKKGNDTFRCGGFGYSVGDEGSGYWIGKQALSVFSKQIDGRVKKSALYDIMVKELQLQDAKDIVHYVNKEIEQDRRKIAQISKYVSLAAQAGDASALKILQQAAEELAALVECLMQNFHEEEVLVSFWGGVLTGEEIVQKCFIEKLPEQCRCIPPKGEVEKAAYYIAKRNLKEV